MPMHPELSPLRLDAPPRPGRVVATAVLGLLLSGCTVLKPADPQPAASVRATVPAATNASVAAPAATMATPASAPAPGTSSPVAAAAPQPMATSSSQSDPAAAAHSLAGYAERLRSMQQTELSAELTRLGSSVAPQSQLQLALALAQMHQLPDLIRAQETVAKVLGNSSDEAKALHPMAKLLAVRLSEERRLEDLLDKQNQQVKDLQRRLDQTTERLEALKAIERSLVSRPTPVLPSVNTPSASGSRARTGPASPPALSTSPSTSAPTSSSASQPASPPLFPSTSPARNGLPLPGPQP